VTGARNGRLHIECVTTQIVRVGELLTDPGENPSRYGIDVAICGGKVLRVGAAHSDNQPDIDASGCIGMPPLVNAHDHGRGLRTLAFGALDDALEVWLPALRVEPLADPYLMAAVAFARMAKSGVSTVVHAHNPQDMNNLREEAAAVSRAAADVGIRVAFVVPIADANPLVYGPTAPLQTAHTAGDWKVISTWTDDPLNGREQVAQALSIAEQFETPSFSVQLGPVGPQWCTEQTLRLIAETSAETGRRVHTHLLETQIQREWSDATYSRGLVRHLDDIGLLSSRLVVAHGVWLTPDECDLLAERDVTVVVNTSSNLRLRSGLAPVGSFLKAGTPFAFGLDGMSLDDDDDTLRELRLAFLLHAGSSLRAGLTPRSLFEAAQRVGYRCFNGDDGYGKLVEGGPADILVLDSKQFVSDLLPGTTTLDALLARATSSSVKDLLVNGREVVRDGQVRGVDLPALQAELTVQSRKAAGTDDLLLMRRHQQVLRTYYTNRCHLNAED
jgi:cytosine/adenosine deaminase-related metal-dependent hydrolase